MKMSTGLLNRIAGRCFINTRGLPNDSRAPLGRADTKSPALGWAVDLLRYNRQHGCADNFASLHYGELLNSDVFRVPH